MSVTGYSLPVFGNCSLGVSHSIIVVFQKTARFSYFKPHAHEVIDILRDPAANDPSLTIRVVARKTLGMMPPKRAQ
jgi:hypothetical protein